MKTIKIEKFGGPEVLEVKDIEIGKPGPKEVLIKIYQLVLTILMFITEQACILFLFQVELVLRHVE